MKKTILCFISIFLVLIIAVSLTSCREEERVENPVEENKTETAIGSSDDTFVLVWGDESTDKVLYYRDTTFDAMFVVINEYNKAGITQLIDPNTGLPLTYGDWCKYKEASKTE